MIRLLFCYIFFYLIISLGACTKSNTPVVSPIPVIYFAKGADVSWVTEMEDAGVKFYNSAGVQQECMSILKDKGINSVRLRAWVNPSAGWNNTKDVVKKALRAQTLGLKIMIDFHYSDTWADPSHQTKPVAWSSLTTGQLISTLSAYTTGVMDTLKLNGILPDWVQIGNETNDGMLWENGRASTSMANFASLIKSGYQAVKSVSPTTLVIVHLSNGYDNNLFRWMFDGLKSNGATWDIIGMSLYPSYAPQGVSGWVSVNQACLDNMSDMVSRYNTPVMVVEVGMPYNQPDMANQFLADIISKTKSVANHQGLGVFYWEPECYNNWNSYTLGAFDNTGKPTTALDAFMN
ncbi:MAG: glycosyl hydrolase 53 family protein [Bacteroidetes bacterium]|nr:glycosyl hydrolase 53 family protein [Bacteroidota bacterium]MBS1541456.1 glycosyl hydrolase 53 family protein [Bacteroidota bacterium]